MASRAAAEKFGNIGVLQNQDKCFLTAPKY